MLTMFVLMPLRGWHSFVIYASLHRVSWLQSRIQKQKQKKGVYYQSEVFCKSFAGSLVNFQGKSYACKKLLKCL